MGRVRRLSGTRRRGAPERERRRADGPWLAATRSDRNRAASTDNRRARNDEGLGARRRLRWRRRPLDRVDLRARTVCGHRRDRRARARARRTVRRALRDAHAERGRWLARRRPRGDRNRRGRRRAGADLASQGERATELGPRAGVARVDRRGSRAWRRRDGRSVPVHRRQHVAGGRDPRTARSGATAPAVSASSPASTC